MLYLLESNLLSVKKRYLIINVVADLQQLLISVMKINTQTQPVSGREMKLYNTFTSTKKESADLVTFTEEIFNGKLHFLCSASTSRHPWWTDSIKITLLAITSWFTLGPQFAEFIFSQKTQEIFKILCASYVGTGESGRSFSCIRRIHDLHRNDILMDL